MTRIHRKVRTGCAQCRRRRIKCDETRPSCANCDRHGMACSLDFLTPINSSSRAQAAVRHSQTVAHISQVGVLPSPPKIGREVSHMSFDSQTCELLHHYVNVVSISITGNRTPSTWHISILQIGLAYPFLRHGITALSALHLGALLPARKHELETFAVSQECAALPSFRASVSSPDSDSIHATFAFAGAVVYYIMALPDGVKTAGQVDRSRIPNKDDAYPHWFHMIRGMMALFSNHAEDLVNGPFAVLFSDYPVPDYVLNYPDDQHLVALEGMFPPSGTHSDLVSSEARNAEVCKEALEELRKVLILTHVPYREQYGEVSYRIWPGAVSQDFVELIYERDPRALVILAHFCVVLKRNDHHWYLKGLGLRMLENIWQALDEEWRPWIRWPMEQAVPTISTEMVTTAI